MGIIRIFGKLAALAALGIGTVLKLIGDFAVGVSGMLLRLIATILFVIAIVCRIFSVSDWGQSSALIVVSFIISVSYTHLDVYKRQPSSCVSPAAVAVANCLMRFVCAE